MSSVGIIGGADGPTAVLVASNIPLGLLAVGALALVGVAVLVIMLLLKRK